ncbi:MAG TPA: hypothetical protein VFO46_06655 [Candidatus Sulfotelmatobacter sp.]|nr:hypothetical protein [Candidatus Sulfotelmatobacter sp.]
MKIAFSLHVAVFLLVFLSQVDLLLSSQSSSSVTAPSKIVPESGFLSPGKYTNAYFGFSLPIPQEINLRERTLSLNRSARNHFLLGFHSPNAGLVSFSITATEAPGVSEKESKKVTAGPNSSKSTETKIGGKTFWRSESSTKTGDRTMQRVVFSTSLDNYVLQFEFVSFSSDTTREIERHIGQLAFFDPSQAKFIAGADSKPYMPGAANFPVSCIAQLSFGSISGNLYRNEDLRFEYQFPEGWVLMSKAVNGRSGEDGQFMWGNSPVAQEEHEGIGQCTRTLLFVRRYPEAPSTGEFNPMVLLLAADPKCFSGSGFPKAIDDRPAIQELARQIVHFFRTTTTTPQGPTTARAIRNAGRIMMEVSQSFILNAPGQTAPVTLLTSILIMQAGDNWVMWVFASGGKADMEELLSTKIFFDDPVALPANP